MQTDYALGVDMGGTNIKVLAVAPDGQVLLEERAPTGDDPDHPGAWKDAVKGMVAKMSREFGSPRAIGICCPGMAAGDNRSIVSMPGRLEGIEGFDWTNYLQSPTMVPVLNDAHAALVAEAWKGAASGRHHVILLTLGTGVGGAILIGGRLYGGTTGRAGHIGHTSLNPLGAPDITGTPGSLEDAIGESTLPRRGGGAYASTEALVAAYRRGEAAAAQIWLDSLRALAASLTSLINVLDPELIVLGGGMIKANEALFKPLNDFMEEMEWQPLGERVPIVPAQLGDVAGALGAARFARGLA